MSDYINRKEAIEYLKEACEAGCVDSFLDQQRREVFREAIECIESIETIDAEPVKCGTWTDETYLPWGLVHRPYICSVCGKRSTDASRYCPNCGAKMDA